MIFESKFDNNEIVWFMHDNIIQLGRIFQVRVTKDCGSQPAIKYKLYGFHDLHDERTVFRTKKELLESL